MKTIVNKQTEMNFRNPDFDPKKPEDVDNPRTIKATYSKLIEFCVNQPPSGGMDAGEMRNRLRILDAIDGVDVDEEARFEDSDAAKLQSIVAEVKWATLHPELLEFLDDIEAL